MLDSHLFFERFLMSMDLRRIYALHGTMVNRGFAAEYKVRAHLPGGFSGAVFRFFGRFFRGAVFPRASRGPLGRFSPSLIFVVLPSRWISPLNIGLARMMVIASLPTRGVGVAWAALGPFADNYPDTGGHR